MHAARRIRAACDIVMIGILVTHRFPAETTARMEQVARAHGREIAWIHLPADPEARVADADLPRIAVAFYSSDMYDENRSRSFFSAVRKAPSLRWLHTFNVGVDHPIFGEILARGAKITTSAGTTAVPIAQHAITGLLMFARGFPALLAAQRRHEWIRVRRAGQPKDLAGQTLCVLGLGAIGREIARLGQALGLHVVGIRRSPRQDADPVDELLPPAALNDVLARTQWLAIACPLTPETRKLIDAAALARLPRGAYVLNIARGAIVDEAALIAALQSGQLGGAYLDVFEQEPLPAESPLWDLPNVVVTPHSAAAATGNEARVLDLLVANFERWIQTRPMSNEVTQPTS